MNLRYALRSLLLLTAIVAGYCVAHQLYANWYASTFSGYYVNDVLARRIHNGDSASDVARFFDKYAPAVSVAERELIAEIYSGSETEKEDEFLHFQSGKNGALLQFRNGTLVNHNNKDYVDSQLVAQINRDIIPPAVFRYGVLPFYASLVLGGGILGWLYGRHAKGKTTAAHRGAV